MKTLKISDRRWWQSSKRVLLFTLTALMLMSSATAAVQVTTTNTAHATIAEGYRNMSWGSALGYAVWDEDYDAAHHDYFYASVTPASLLTGKCLITLFDWDRYMPPGLSDHYDSRVARSCKPSTFHETYGFFESAGAVLLGMQKLGQCAGNQFAETGGNCVTQYDSEYSVPGSSLDPYCSAQWTRYYNNSTSFGNAGDPTSCTF